MKEEYLTPFEFAAKIKRSLPHIYRLLRAGKLKFVEKGPGLKKIKMIPVEELKKFNP